MMRDERGNTMDEYTIVESWLSELRTELGLDDMGEIDIPAMLTAVREIAHAVIHPAGPIAMIAIGYAAAKADGSAETIAEILEQTVDLAHQFGAEHGVGDDA